MRTDPKKNEDFTESKSWDRQKYVQKSLIPQPDGGEFKYKANSFSAGERNHFFLRHEDNFSNLTLVSGADAPGDGRGFAVLDYDGDGWLDIALVAANYPRFKLYRNRMADLVNGNQRVRVRLRGGHTKDTPTATHSNRDGIGAKLLVTYRSGKTLMLHRQAGEGNVAQNSETIWIGVPAGDEVASISVQWPSGQRSQLENVQTAETNLIVESPSSGKLPSSNAAE